MTVLFCRGLFPHYSIEVCLPARGLLHMPTLAHRNLFHDKIRLAVTLTGVAFAVVLIVIEMGLYVGFTKTTSSLIDHSGADFWVATKDIPYLELGAPFRERKLYRVKTAPGVSEAARFVMEGVRWTRPDGAQQLIQVVGFDPDSGMGGPWNMVEGDAYDLKIPDGGGRLLVNVPSHRGRADKGNSANFGITQQSVYRAAPAVHHVQHQPGPSSASSGQPPKQNSSGY